MQAPCLSGGLVLHHAGRVVIREPAELRADASLAIYGGRKPRELPPDDSGVSSDAAAAVAEVIKGGTVSHWKGGPAKRELEAVFSRMMNRKHGCFLNSGSAALLIAILSTRTDEKTREKRIGITASYVSAINSIYHARARPVFLKTDPDTLVAQPQQDLPDDRFVDMLLATHFLGNGVDVEHLGASIDATVNVVDASQALGACIHGAPVGAVGDIVSFSGSYRKLLGAGLGGVNVFDDGELGDRMETLAHHGINAAEIPTEPGFSAAGGEMEATLALAALRKLDSRVRQRRASAATILRVLGEAGVDCAAASRPVGDSIVWFKVGILLPEYWLGDRDWLVEALRVEGVPAWRYPSLIGLPWVRPWMEQKGWWGDWECDLLKHEGSIWDRVVTINTQVSVGDAERVASIFAEMLVR